MKSLFNWTALLLAIAFLLGAALGDDGEPLTTSEYMDHYEGRQ